MLIWMYVIKLLETCITIRHFDNCVKSIEVRVGISVKIKLNTERSDYLSASSTRS